MLYCPNFFWNVLQVWMTGKDVYLQMTWSWPDKTWNILCSCCLQWNTSQSKFRNHYFLFLFAFSILSQLFLIWGCIYISFLLTFYLYIYIYIYIYTMYIEYIATFDQINAALVSKLFKFVHFKFACMKSIFKSPLFIYLYSAFNNTDCVKAALQYQIGK